MSNVQVAELQAYLMLLVQEAGGEVRVPYENAEMGFPKGSGLRIIPDEDAQEIIFRIEVKDAE